MKKRWYVGYRKDGKLKAFSTDVEPDKLKIIYEGEYFALMGAFRTKRGAMYMEKCGQHDPCKQTVG